MGIDDDIPLADLKVTTIEQDRFNPKKPNTPSNAGRTPPKKKLPLPTWKDGVIRDFMTNMYEQLGELIKPYDEPFGYVFLAIAENCGQAWEDCARDSPTIRRWLHQMMSASKLSKLAFAHAPLALLTIHRFGPMRQVTDDMAEEMAERLANERSNTAA
jgi:hypothetical protein